MACLHCGHAEEEHASGFFRHCEHEDCFHPDAGEDEAQSECYDYEEGEE